MKNRYEHRCQDSECGYFNQPTFSTCRCHKTREEMQDAERDEFLGALQAIEDYHIPDCPAHFAGNELAWAQKQHGHLRGIARAIIAKAEKQP